ncbi:YeeE/YedE family protein [Microbacterium sediminis]|uniref:Sulfur transporter n=1 Tax=Microbacterium sediminis TaxID=904291 RepID=A0A1B9NGL3_9MICO|nr:YeeE/YedE family protein [Microbacterium sediminis]OCG75749.1 sulfur transporter [Microbacterium sediminis]QBR74143.1 YeeE/YedE family protein [Microbacterium sediminis]
MIVTGLAVGALLGYLFQRGRFCVTAAYRDIWLSRNTRMLSALLLLIAVHAAGLFALQGLGIVSLPAQTFPWLASIVGGLIFGFAIILAGGCATGTYYRAGEGLVGSWFALVFYGLFAAIAGTGPLAGVTEWLKSFQIADGTIHDTLGVSPWVLVVVLAAIAGALAVHHARKVKTPVATLPPRKTGLAHILFEKRLNPFLVAALIGVIATIAWPLSAATGRNSGLGITGPSRNIAGYLVTGDTGLIDWGVFLVAGILLGATISAVASGEFRVRVPDAATIVRSIVGGALMGIGATIAGGCTVGNSMVATAQFSYQGWVATGAMILGAGIAVKISFRQTLRTANKLIDAPAAAAARV